MKITRLHLRRLIKESLIKEGTLFVTRGDYGYIGLGDDQENEWGLGEVIAELIDAGINNIFQGQAAIDGVDEVAFDRMLQQDGGNVQGGMENWDSDVFETYYNVDPDRVIMAFAKLKGLEIQEATDEEDEYEDDGTNAFEEYYS